MSKHFIGEHVKKLEIVRQHPDNFSDGYPTHLEIDGLTLSKRDLSMHEKIITLECEPGFLGIHATFNDRLPIIFVPEEFEFQYGCLQVKKHPKYNPCKISIGSCNLVAVQLLIRFAEGEMPAVQLKFKPQCKPFDWNPGD